MYLSTARQSDASAGTPTGPGRRRVAGAVFALGTVSLITDISSEMVTAVLPLYFVVGLGLSPLQFGFLDGLYTGATAFARLVGGQVADRLQRRKAVAGFGYGLSAVSKLGLLAAGSSLPLIGTVLTVDRCGKGVRTAPRDALISLHSAPDVLGRSFGVHRAMDTIGALLGPLVAFGVLASTANSFDSTFFASFCIASLGVVVLVLFVRDRPSVAVESKSTSLRAAFGLLRDPAFRRVCVGAALLGLVTVGDAFVYLLLQRTLGIDVMYFPLLPLGTALVYLLLAVPLGRLADRFGRWRMFLLGYVALLLVYLVLLGPVGGPVLLVLALALHGTYYAATDGVLMAAASTTLPSHLRSSGLAMLATGQALGRLVASVAFGFLWTVWGTDPALVAFSVGLVLVGAAVVVARSGEVS